MGGRVSVGEVGRLRRAGRRLPAAATMAIVYSPAGLFAPSMQKYSSNTWTSSVVLVMTFRVSYAAGGGVSIVGGAIFASARVDDRVAVLRRIGG